MNADTHNSEPETDELAPMAPLAWSRGQRPSLSAIFNRATQMMPDLAGSVLLGSGAFGIVADHGDGSVTKICLRYKDLIAGMDPQKTVDSEIRALRTLRAAWPDGVLRADGADTGIAVPVMIGEPFEFSTNSPFLTAFRMTKLAGETRNWFPLVEHADAPDMTDDFTVAGAALARFHKAVAGLDLPVAVHSDGHRLDHIRTVPHMSPRINTGLIMAQRFLDTQKMSGIIHGDFHGGNIMTAPDGRITGVIDLSMMGASDNVISDFVSVPFQYINVFTAAYEDAARVKINPDVPVALSLSWLARWAQHARDDAESMMMVTERINERLNRLTFVTGVKP